MSTINASSIQISRFRCLLAYIIVLITIITNHQHNIDVTNVINTKIFITLENNMFVQLLFINITNIRIITRISTISILVICLLIAMTVLGTVFMMGKQQFTSENLLQHQDQDESECDIEIED